MSAQIQTKDRYAHIEFEGVRFPHVQRVILPAPLIGGPRPVGPVITPRLDASDYSLLAMVLDHMKVNLKHYRREALIRRIPACLRALRVQNSTEACIKLQSSPEWLTLAADALLIGVTHFFRDGCVFDLLQETIIPDILTSAPGCRVLSLACSDGAELYSVAMILENGGALKQSTLLGIDCRLSAIQSARQGWFSPGCYQNMPADMQRRYFSSIDLSGAVVTPVLQRSTRWQVANVVTFESDHPWDLVMCRNLAIYLSPSMAATLWNRVSKMLKTGGYLVVGKAERPTGGFVRVAPCVYRKQ